MGWGFAQGWRQVFHPDSLAAAEHAPFAHLRAYLGDRLLPEGSHRPIAFAAGNAAHEIAQTLQNDLKGT